MHYGESSKKEMIGRYGHGFKDTALKIGKCIYIGCKYENWKIFEKKDDWPVLYQPIGEDLGVKEGTWFIVPLKDTVTFEYEHEKIKYTGEKAILESHSLKTTVSKSFFMSSPITSRYICVIFKFVCPRIFCRLRRFNPFFRQ